MKAHLGFSLIELLLVLSSVGFIVLFISNLPQSIHLIALSRQNSLVREIAQKQIEQLRAKPFSDLANSSTPIIDARLSTLSNGAGTVIIDPCPSPICSSSLDPLYPKIKKITAQVSWLDGGKSQSFSVTTLIAEGGLK